MFYEIKNKIPFRGLIKRFSRLREHDLGGGGGKQTIVPCYLSIVEWSVTGRTVRH